MLQTKHFIAQFPSDNMISKCFILSILVVIKHLKEKGFNKGCKDMQ